MLQHVNALDAYILLYKPAIQYEECIKQTYMAPVLRYDKLVKGDQNAYNLNRHPFSAYHIVAFWPMVSVWKPCKNSHNIHVVAVGRVVWDYNRWPLWKGRINCCTELGHNTLDVVP